MDLTQKLIELLNNYIEENKKLKEKFNKKRTNQTLYEELITTLKEQPIEESKIFVPILLNTIYGNNIYVDEFYSILLKSNKEEELRNFISKLENEYKELKQENNQLNLRILRNSEIVSSAYRTRKSLSLNTEILNSKNDVFNVKKIINYYGISGVISTREEILLINEIETHNRRVATKHGSKKDQDYTESLYSEIPNILTIGFQEHDKIEVSKERKTTLDKFVKEIINLIDHIEKEQIIKLIENYQKYNLDNNEYNYIITNVLDTYLEELTTLYTLLLDKTVYRDKDSRTEIVKNYYDVLNKYLIIQNYYTSELEYTPEDDDDTETKNIDYQQEKRLIYSHSNTNMNKARLISDMSDIPYEYYDRVYDLITRFKNGTIGIKEFKALTSHRKFRGHLELRYDQVRIILKHISGNIYNILGVFAKKTNNDMTMYGRIINRMIPDVDTNKKLEIQLELATRTEKELENLVKEKGRKGTR